MDGGVRHRVLALNAAANLAGRVAAVVLALAVATVLFRQLDPADYGAWSLLITVTGYSMLFDFGLAGAVERGVASRWVSRDVVGISRLISTALTLFGLGLVGLQGAIGLWLAWPSRAVWGEGRLDQGLLILPLCMGLTAAALIVGAGLSGLQRMGLMQTWRVAGLALGSTATVVAAVLGVRRLDALLVAYCAGGGLSAVLQWRALRALVPGLRLRPELDWQAASELTRFGGVLQAATIVPAIAEYSFRLIIGARFGLDLAGVYDLASRAAIVLRSLAGALFAAMVPFGVRTFAEQGARGTTRLLRATVKYTTLSVWPASAVLWSQSDNLVHLWLGEGPGTAQVSLGFRILLVAHAVGAFSAPVAMLGRSAGRPAFEGLVTGVSCVAALVVAAAWRPSWPVLFALTWGAPAAGGLVIWWMLSRALGVGAPHIRELGLVAALAAVCWTGAEVGAWLAGRLGVSSLLARFVLAAGTAAAVFLVGSVRLRLVGGADWRSLREAAGAPTQ